MIEHIKDNVGKTLKEYYNMIKERRKDYGIWGYAVDTEYNHYKLSEIDLNEYGDCIIYDEIYSNRDYYCVNIDVLPSLKDDIYVKILAIVLNIDTPEIFTAREYKKFIEEHEKHISLLEKYSIECETNRLLWLCIESK